MESTTISYMSYDDYLRDIQSMNKNDIAVTQFLRSFSGTADNQPYEFQSIRDFKKDLSVDKNGKSAMGEPL